MSKMVDIVNNFNPDLARTNQLFNRTVTISSCISLIVTKLYVVPSGKPGSTTLDLGVARATELRERKVSCIDMPRRLVSLSQSGRNSLACSRPSVSGDDQKKRARDEPSSRAGFSIVPTNREPGTSQKQPVIEPCQNPQPLLKLYGSEMKAMLQGRTKTRFTTANLKTETIFHQSKGQSRGSPLVPPSTEIIWPYVPAGMIRMSECIVTMPRQFLTAAIIVTPFPHQYNI